MLSNYVAGERFFNLSTLLEKSVLSKWIIISRSQSVYFRKFKAQAGVLCLLYTLYRWIILSKVYG